MPKVLVSTSSFGAVQAAPGEGAANGATPLERLEAAGYEVVRNPHGRTLAADEVLGLAAGCVGIVAGTEPFTDGVMRALPELRAISRVGTGMDSVDLDAARRLGIAVTNTPEAPSAAVAELAVAMMLDMLRRVSEQHAAVKRGEWPKAMGSLLAGKCVGLVGLGRVGKKVAVLVRCFGAEVLACDPCADEGWAVDHAVTLAPLERVLARADIVSLHAPCPEENAGLIGSEALARMKPGAYLVNTARGQLVDEDALVDALASGHLAGAALDVFRQEPYDGPLTALPNVLLTPHIGSYAREARARMEAEAVENLLEALGP